MDDKLVRFFNKIGFLDLDSFKDSKVIKVTINKKDETWNVYIENKIPVNINSAINLINVCKKGIDEVRKINVIFINNSINEDKIIEYFKYLLNNLIEKSPALSSILDNIDGIGSKRRDMLLKKFKTITKLKELSIEELKEVLPDNVAVELYNFLKK